MSNASGARKRFGPCLTGSRNSSVVPPISERMETLFRLLVDDARERVHDGAGLTVKEIARRMDITENAVIRCVQRINIAGQGPAGVNIENVGSYGGGIVYRISRKNHQEMNPNLKWRLA